MDRLRFRSLASGSSGNSYFVGNASMGILIDAGIGVRTIRKHLKDMGMDFTNIWGVFVTHDHADHIRAVGNIGEKYNVPIYSTKNIHEGINKNYGVTQKLSHSRRFFEIGEPICIGDFQISAFPVSHDATESVGYSIVYQEKRITFATDLGYIDSHTGAQLVDSDYLILEANYDEEMLQKGRYPDHLKKRIIAQTGHLGNEQTAQFIAQNYTNRWKKIFLCHLSKDNNTPQKAYQAISDRLDNHYTDMTSNLEIVPLPRTSPSRLFIF